MEQGPQHINGMYSVDRVAVPGTSGGMLVHFEQHSWSKPRNRWTPEEEEAHKKTGLPIKENVDCIVYTLDGGLNVSPPVRVRREDEGTQYFDPDTGFLTDDIQRFPRQWAAYQKGLGAEDQVPGYSLKHYFKNDPAKVDHYRYHKIYTVEQLAEMPVTLQQRIGLGAVTDSNKAKEFLESTRVSAGDTQAREELQTLREQNEIFKAQIAELMEAARLKKPGRPRKEVEESDE